MADLGGTALGELHTDIYRNSFTGHWTFSTPMGFQYPHFPLLDRVCLLHNKTKLLNRSYVSTCQNEITSLLSIHYFIKWNWHYFSSIHDELLAPTPLCTSFLSPGCTRPLSWVGSKHPTPTETLPFPGETSPSRKSTCKQFLAVFRYCPITPVWFNVLSWAFSSGAQSVFHKHENLPGGSTFRFGKSKESLCLFSNLCYQI